MSSSNTHTPCAACKLQRRKCTQECVFAPYFPPDQPQKFANVHKVFGASNVGKILNELNAAHREDAVTSLAYEAESRLKNPVYGCVGFISILQDRLKQVQLDLYNAKKELSAYMGPAYHGPQQLDVNTSMHMLGVVVTGSPLQNYSGGAQLMIGKNHQHQYHHRHQQQLFNCMDVVGPSSFKQMPGGEGALDLGGPFDNNNVNHN